MSHGSPAPSRPKSAPSTTRQPTGAGRRGVSSRQILITFSSAAVFMAVLGAVLFWRYSATAVSDPRRIAVAPFDIPDSAGAQLSWRVGLANGLTERLAAGGQFTTVPQTQVADVWGARATPIIAALELARRTAAGLALYGRVDREATDTLVLRAAIIDANSTVGLFEVAIRVPPTTAMAHAADTLATELLARLNGS